MQLAVTLVPTTLRQNRRAALALAADEVRTTAYQAYVEHFCSACGQTIPADGLFSRRSREVAPFATGQLNTVPVCTACQPLPGLGGVPGRAVPRRLTLDAACPPAAPRIGERSLT